jgi:hypothetical protein
MERPGRERDPFRVPMEQLALRVDGSDQANQEAADQIGLVSFTLRKTCLAGFICC